MFLAANERCRFLKRFGATGNMGARLGSAFAEELQ
jgi:hypothetical protein